ncbi:MAG: hypothetical protein Q7S58_19035 [Candidatus Binatus sp.]|nr:hypothetical protein [Candidatus Binatus sp.]MDO8434496.1 hypothetical protein [Candidatus Binatus sp.]
MDWNLALANTIGEIVLILFDNTWTRLLGAEVFIRVGLAMIIDV